MGYLVYLANDIFSLNDRTKTDLRPPHAFLSLRILQVRPENLYCNSVWIGSLRWSRFCKVNVPLSTKLSFKGLHRCIQIRKSSLRRGPRVAQSTSPQCETSQIESVAKFERDPKKQPTNSQEPKCVKQKGWWDFPCVLLKYCWSTWSGFCELMTTTTPSPLRENVCSLVVFFFNLSIVTNLNMPGWKAPMNPTCQVSKTCLFKYVMLIWNHTYECLRESSFYQCL